MHRSSRGRPFTSSFWCGLARESMSGSDGRVGAAGKAQVETKKNA